MSSLQTMTAPAVGHRPPDPGIDMDNKKSPVEDVQNHPYNHKEGAVRHDAGWPAKANGEEDEVAVPDNDNPATETEPPTRTQKNEDGNPHAEEEKQSAATSLLAQLLGNAQPAAPSTPDNLPQTPMPEPLTDVSTPVAPHEDSSRAEADFTKTHGVIEVHKASDLVSGQKKETIDTVQDKNNSVLEPAAAVLEETSQIPDMVSGVMEDPLSKSVLEQNGLFPPFDHEASMKNGLGSLQQQDTFANTFLAQEIGMSGLPDMSGYTSSYNDVAASISGSEPRIQAFAKLEFDDGHFYVNTYSFILGRDVRAARAAHQRDIQVRQAMGRPSKNKSSSGGNTSHTPNRVKRDGSAYMGSVVSDRGGIMGFDPDVPHHMNQRSRKSSVSSQPESALHATPAQLQTNHTDYNALAMQSLYDASGEAKPVDTLALLPSPDACPTIPIHPPATADGSAAGHKGISRKHVKISYNFDKNLFEMEVMGRNGAFIGADWLAPGQLRPLHSGDYIQIGGVRIRFLLPDVPIGETGADRLEDTFMEEDGTILSGEIGQDLTGDVDAMDESDEESPDGTQKSRVTKLVLKTKSPGDPSNETPTTPVDGPETPQPKRRGPGRPPKDGIMSKRERAELAREQKMAAKREANGGVTPPPSNRIKPPKPRKEDSVEEVSKQPEKKKFAKRKQPDGTYIDVPIESIEDGEQLPPDQVVEYPKPPPKKRKPSRSPSPDYPPESSYTQDQLAKPPYNYAVLIFDALTEAHAPMTLKQIYRALKLKYPYFRFKCETEGWTSSVRHNLNGNRQLFEHAERDGKGWSWQLRAGASVEKEKKRRPSPPPPSTHLPQPSHQHNIPSQNHHYSSQGVPHHQQFQFSSVPTNNYNPPPPISQPNTYRPPPAPPPPPPSQSSLPPPLRSLNIPGALAPTGSSTYVSPYSCPLPPEIAQLQQSQQLPPQPTMQQQRQPDQAPPPSQEPPQASHHHQQPYQNTMQPSPTVSNQQPIMNQTEEPESSASFLERANKAIDDFEALLMEDYDDKDYIREVLKSARARALGHAKESSFADGEPKDEAVLLNAIRDLIESLKSNTS
ncbi:hypothetical protein BGW36DRAFT_296069 [Talaromyces proteolyticus]|uniref:Fork-head domain-containing protein n=1 Tax=Talaromyces proteolyticus TaxID=1131652 RepID=A0AAD4KQF9_9EURO|nr:uncharacterized protein BGW36DRAFT_296069 [Talaromyces proteolyticus]KAH8697085.1 hypothetical protein BGW36DRAFT_296069 [Talaromyces proteolyticus]